MDEEELIEAVVAGFERSEYVKEWPADEIEFHRNGMWTDFTERRAEEQRMRAVKIIALVRGHERGSNSQDSTDAVK